MTSTLVELRARARAQVSALGARAAARRAEIATRDAARIARRDSWTLIVLIRQVAASHAVTVEEIAGRSKRRDIATARFQLWSELASELGWSHRTIAHVFGVDRKAVDTAIDRYLNRQERIRSVS